MPEVRILPFGVPDNFRAYEFSSTQWLDSILIFLGWDFLAGIKAVFGRRLLSFLLWRQGCLWYLTQDSLNFRSCALVWGLILSPWDPWVLFPCILFLFRGSLLGLRRFHPRHALISAHLMWCGPSASWTVISPCGSFFSIFFFLLTLAALVPLNPSIASFSGRLWCPAGLQASRWKHLLAP